MLRVIGFSLLMLFAIAVTLPVADSYAGYGTKSSWHKRSKKMTRRQRQAYMRRRRAALRRRRMLARLQQDATKSSGAAITSDAKLVMANIVRAATLPGAPRITTPAGWNGGSAAGGEMRWQVSHVETSGTVNVTFAPLGTASADDNSPNNRRYRTLGGRAHADLRRQVIDRMIAEGGWVTNDVERTIGGHPSFVVYAASGSQVEPREWAFYYTVVDNRLYRFVSDAPGSGAKRIAGEIESIVASLRSPSPAPLTARSQQSQ